MLKFLKAEISYFTEMVEEAFAMGAACPRTVRGLVACQLLGAGVSYEYKGALLCRLAERVLPAVELEHNVVELGDIKLSVAPADESFSAIWSSRRTNF